MHIISRYNEAARNDVRAAPMSYVYFGCLSELGYLAQLRLVDDTDPAAVDENQFFGHERGEGADRVARSSRLIYILRVEPSDS